MVRAVIFDFFGVLVTEGFRQFRETHFAGDKQKERRALDLINRVDSGSMSTEEFTSQLASLADIPPEEIDKQLGNNKPNRALLDYIKLSLKDKYKLSILSNSSEDYPRQLLRKEDVELFNDILLSYRFGVIKPQPEIYRLAADRLGIQPSEAIFIDDSEGHCEGAKRAGMKTITYSDFQKFQTELGVLLSSGSNN